MYYMRTLYLQSPHGTELVKHIFIHTQLQLLLFDRDLPEHHSQKIILTNILFHFKTVQRSREGNDPLGSVNSNNNISTCLLYTSDAADE